MTMRSCSLMFVPLVVIGVARIASALRTGTIQTRFGGFDEKDRPVRFRVDLAILTCAVGVCCFMILGGT